MSLLDRLFGSHSEPDPNLSPIPGVPLDHPANQPPDENADPTVEFYHPYVMRIDGLTYQLDSDRKGYEVVNLPYREEAEEEPPR